MVSEKTVRRILDRDIGEDLVSLEKSSIGRAHETFFVSTKSSELVLKVSNSERRFQVEGPVLKLLNEQTEVSVPKLRCFDNSQEDFEFMYLIMDRVSGENIDNWENNKGPKFSYLSRERKRELLRDAGKQLGLLHSQTDFDSFGHFKSEGNSLEFRTRGSWSEVFREIIIEQQADNLPERFSHLRSPIKEFVGDHITTIKPGRPSIIHQDFRWPNVLCGKRNIKAVIDWERALSGDPVYDFVKAEKSLLQFKRIDTRERYLEYLVEGYRTEANLPEDWRWKRDFYRALRPVEALWTFEGWTKEMNEEKKDLMADRKEKELLERIEEFDSR